MHKGENLADDPGLEAFQLKVSRRARRVTEWLKSPDKMQDVSMVEITYISIHLYTYTSIHLYTHAYMYPW